ncbi:general stress protein CsbD [Niastella yeongjuensis]|uniref:General stress protein CsbD n=1 Tax=Niastella yeongjuensis TaxID=354355 RepID=A0A1V9EDJ1_9BACT|nr:general stress protein CsbD [Niastella yeongjuensis]OQP44197.1 general stress protein CsbD [Niastella yeongjuensis]SEP21753.1 hypothetical protein SAMN05660816_04817 [Niastella yeongjuensis]
MQDKTTSSGNWNEQKTRLKKEFPALTDKDLFFEIGRKNEMMAKLQVKLGKTKEELQRIIDAS